MSVRDLFHTFPDMPQEPEIIEDLLDLICLKETERRQEFEGTEEEINDLWNKNELLEDDLWDLKKEVEGLEEELEKLKQGAADDWWSIWVRENR
jgi:predicted RNase H-like nuclease (RuvC/YqgF family)